MSSNINNFLQEYSPEVTREKNNNDTIDTCNISEIDERPKVDKHLDKDNFSINLFSNAFKDIKLNSLPTDKAQKPLPKQGGEYIFDNRAKNLKQLPKNLVNDLPCFIAKSSVNVLNSHSSSKLLLRDPNLKNVSNFSNDSLYDSIEMSRGLTMGYIGLQNHTRPNKYFCIYIA
jgi:hypothetical protein